MTMFRRQQPQTINTVLQQYASTVEAILASHSINVDPRQARMPTENGFGWSFQRGSALIEVFVSEQDGVGYMQVLAPILHLPMNNLLPLYRRLLEMNLQLTNASLGVWLDVVYLFNERPLVGLDAEEANSIISALAAYADDLDDKIIGEFGGRLYGRA